MQRQARILAVPLAGAGLSMGLAALVTAGSPGQGEAVWLVAACSTAGALAAGAAGLKIFGGGGDGKVFGKKAALPQDQREEVAVAGGQNGEEQKPAREPVVPIRVAQDAAAALAGIKSLIESLQVTDRQTWEKVAGLARDAETALEEMRAGLEAATEAAGRAMEAFRGIAALVEGR